MLLVNCEDVSILNLVEKAKRKFRNKWVSNLRNKKTYKYLYCSYWHSRVFRKKNGSELSTLYFAARPNPGAGIGHQMANWIAGYWFAKYFDLNFAHIPFSSSKWESFLGFYQEEKTISELTKEGYHIVRLQEFDECNKEEESLINNIIKSYAGEKVIFLAEQDQFYHDQYGVMHELQEKFYSAPSRKDDKLIYDSNAFNLAIHVRRGDIVQKTGDDNPNLTMRYQSNDYFVNALHTSVEYFKDKENIQIYLFSQGKPEDFLEFSQIPNIHFCLDMSAQDSFLHMVFADALITSKSSFSYKPALLNRGIKFCPKDFWHGYPKLKDWIVLYENGRMEEK